MAVTFDRNGLLVGTRNGVRVGVPGGADARTAPLSDVEASTLLDLDATITDSYGGTGQTWANLISGGSAYDMFLGATGTGSTDDPTFAGTAGDASGRWEFDGGDFFSIKAAVPAALSNVTKTTGGNDMWAAFSFKTPPSDPGDSLCTLMATLTVAGSTIGFAINLRFFGSVMDIQFDTRGTGGTTQTDSTATLTYDSINIVLVSFDNSAGNVRYWVNSSTGETKAHALPTNTTDCDDFHIAARESGGGEFTNGMELYSAAFGNGYLDDTAAGAIIDQLNVRHEDYQKKTLG